MLPVTRCTSPRLRARAGRGLIGLLLLAPTAAAEERTTTAEQLILQGDELMRSSNFAEGTARYREAFVAAPHFIVACKAGRGEAQLERYPQAAHYLSYCLEHFTSTPNEREREARVRYEELLKDILGEVGVVNLELTPSDAEVRIGDEPARHPANPNQLFLPVGEHQVAISAPGFASLSRQVTVTAGRPQVLRVSLTALPSQDVSPTDLSAPRADTRPQAADSSLTLRNVLVVSGAVVAAGAIVGGVVLAEQRGSIEDEISGLAPRLPRSGCGERSDGACGELRALQSDWKTADRVSKVLFGVGVGFGVASVLTFFLWPNDTQGEVAGRPLFMADPQVGSVTLGWRGGF